VSSCPYRPSELTKHNPRCPLTAYPNVSVSNYIFLLLSGIANVGGFIILLLSLLKAFFFLSFYFHFFFPINSVRGLVTLANPGMNLQ